MTDYAALMGSIYIMVKQDYMMQVMNSPSAIFLLWRLEYTIRP